MLNWKGGIVLVLQLLALYQIGWWARDIRMHAIRTYGMVIHEFDPWFNFRATQYLADNGLSKFFHWYDYMSWYPLGRPVGTTIYPGMQMVSVFLWQILNKVGYAISLNDVCCMVPVWFGVFCTMMTGLLTYVASGSRNAGVMAAAIMSVVPAHLMRSVGGGFDNESVAISCLVLTFLLWCYALSGADDTKITFKGILVGLAYTCMVASWGGFVFVLNVIGIHAITLVLLGRFSNKLYWSYTLWYIVGTIGAIQVPVVGWTPLKSLEQLGPAGVFGIFQLLKIADHPGVLKFFKVDKDTMTTAQKWSVIVKVFSVAALIASIVAYQLWNIGYFGPLSSRVRGLFVKHTHTGNPLVDSVAEHQPAKPENFYQFLHHICYIAPIGFGIAVIYSVFVPFFAKRKTGDHSKDALLFLVVYACVTYYFALKMNRLMLLMAPISSALGGIALGAGMDLVYDEAKKIAESVFPQLASPATESEEAATTSASTPTLVSGTPSSQSGKGKDGKDSKKAGSASASKKASANDRSFGDILTELLDQLGKLALVQLFRKLLAVAFLYVIWAYVPEFMQYTEDMMYGLSNPSIMFQARLNDGTEIIVDDYREAYHFLRDQTPEDARIMAWWDYGYQITGIGNRTSIADGNTWNHEVYFFIIETAISCRYQCFCRT
jgi:dolichyl-diphosphooligosaccharide--protein glycosyltransferase